MEVGNDLSAGVGKSDVETASQMADEVPKVAVAAELPSSVTAEEGLGGGSTDGADGGRFSRYMGFWNFSPFHFAVRSGIELYVC